MSPQERTPMSMAQNDTLVQAQSDGHRRVTKVTQARSKAQRTKIDHEASLRQQPEGVSEQNEERNTSDASSSATDEYDCAASHQ